MGFFDKLKGAMNSVTGGGAKVTVQYHPPVAYPGEQIQVRVTATSTGAEVKYSAVWVDVQGVEEVRLKKGTVEKVEMDIAKNNTTFTNKFQLAAAGVIGPGQSAVFDGVISLPANAQPSFDGALCDHGWGIRGRLDTFGNDPDSGFQPFKVGLKQ
jgi:sporulation-control protein spo0M